MGYFVTSFESSVSHTCRQARKSLFFLFSFMFFFSHFSSSRVLRHRRKIETDHDRNPPPILRLRSRLVVVSVTEEGSKLISIETHHRSSTTDPPSSFSSCRLLRDRGRIETHHRSKPTTALSPPILRLQSRLLRDRGWIKTHHKRRRLSRSSWYLLRLLSSSSSVEASKPTIDRLSSLFRSSFFSRLLRQKKNRNPPRMTTVSFFTASPPSLLVFSGRRTMQTHSDDECLGPHGVASVGLSSLAHDLYSLEITSQVINLLTSSFCFQFH